MKAAQLGDRLVVPLLGVRREQEVGGLDRLRGEVVEGVGDLCLVLAGVEARDLVEPGRGAGQQGGALALVADADAGVGRLDAALERVEHVARQGRLGDHRQGGRRADQGEPTHRDGEPAFARVAHAAGVGRAQPEPVGLGRLDGRHRRGLGEQPGAQLRDELRTRLRLGYGAQRAHEREQVVVAGVRRPPRVDRPSTTASNSSARRRVANTGLITDVLSGHWLRRPRRTPTSTSPRPWRLRRTGQ